MDSSIRSWNSSNVFSSRSLGSSKSAGVDVIVICGSGTRRVASRTNRTRYLFERGRTRHPAGGARANGRHLVVAGSRQALRRSGRHCSGEPGQVFVRPAAAAAQTPVPADAGIRSRIESSRLESRQTRIATRNARMCSWDRYGAKRFLPIAIRWAL